MLVLLKAPVGFDPPPSQTELFTAGCFLGWAERLPDIKVKGWQIPEQNYTFAAWPERLQISKV